MFLVGKNPDDPGDDTDMEEVGVALLVAARELAAVTYIRTCLVVELIAPVPAVCAATVPVNEYAELFGDGLRWCTVGIRCHSFVLG